MAETAQVKHLCETAGVKQASSVKGRRVPEGLATREPWPVQMEVCLVQR